MWFETTHCRVRVPEIPAGLDVGLGVVVVLAPHRHFKLTGVVEGTEGTRFIDIEIKRVQGREKRYYPRSEGGLELRYRVGEPSERAALRAWRRGIDDTEEVVSWSKPCGPVNFSGSGLRFHTDADASPLSPVQVELRVPDSPTWHRVVAEVVRVLGDGDERSMAVQFVDVDLPTVEALTGFMLERDLDAIQAAAERTAAGIIDS